MMGESAAPPAYRRIAQLGRGGMATVYLAARSGAHDVTKLVVVKELRDDLGDEVPYRRMFLEEGRLAARLNHPNVVQTYEVSEVGGRPMIVMEYLEGQSLSSIRKVAQAAALGPIELHVLLGVLAGLEHAHTLCDFDGTPLHVVHRDVSPHNVFVTYSGEVKLVDFGIAKAGLSRVHTTTNTVKGKIAYMAPEQARGEPVDARTDIFSVGVMLWEALARRRLWKDQPDAVILRRVLAGDVPKPSSVNPSVPLEADALCMRALALDPAERPASARAMGEALEALLPMMGVRLGGRETGEMVATLFASHRQQIRGLVERALAAEEPAVAPRASAPPHGAPPAQLPTTPSGLVASHTLHPGSEAPRASRGGLAAVALGVLVLASLTLAGAAGYVAARAERSPRQATASSDPSMMGLPSAQDSAPPSPPASSDPSRADPYRSDPIPSNSIPPGALRSNPLLGAPLATPTPAPPPLAPQRRPPMRSRASPSASALAPAPLPPASAEPDLGY